MTRNDPEFMSSVSALGYINQLASDHLRTCKSHRCSVKWLDAMDMVENACEAADRESSHATA